MSSFRDLAIQGELLNDLEGVRIANGNRIFAMLAPVEKGGMGLDESHPGVRNSQTIGDVLQTAEDLSTKELRRILKATALHPWLKAQVGIGEKQGARLLAVIGHPLWRHDPITDEWHPRTIAQLWAYCGYHVVKGESPKRKRGEQGNWNTEARTRTYLIAESCVKQMHSPYRAVYDEGRAKYAESLHDGECKRCGPSGKPAQPGSPLSAGHQHARAMRLMAKAILKDLWLAARDAEDTVHAVQDFDGAISAPTPISSAPRPLKEAIPA